MSWSGVIADFGLGMPNPGRPATAFAIGYVSENSTPQPRRYVSRSSTVMARLAGSVSSSGPSIRFSTRRFAKLGGEPCWVRSSRCSLGHPLGRIVEERLLGYELSLPALIREFFHVCGRSIQPLELKDPPDNHTVTVDEHRAHTS